MWLKFNVLVLVLFVFFSIFSVSVIIAQFTEEEYKNYDEIKDAFKQLDAGEFEGNFEELTKVYESLDFLRQTDIWRNYAGKNGRIKILNHKIGFADGEEGIKSLEGLDSENLFVYHDLLLKFDKPLDIEKELENLEENFIFKKSDPFGIDPRLYSEQNTKFREALISKLNELACDGKAFFDFGSPIASQLRELEYNSEKKEISASFDIEPDNLENDYRKVVYSQGNFDSFGNFINYPGYVQKEDIKLNFFQGKGGGTITVDEEGVFHFDNKGVLNAYGSHFIWGSKTEPSSAKFFKDHYVVESANVIKMKELGFDFNHFYDLNQGSDEMVLSFFSGENPLSVHIKDSFDRDSLVFSDSDNPNMKFLYTDGENIFSNAEGLDLIVFNNLEKVDVKGDTIIRDSKNRVLLGIESPVEVHVKESLAKVSTPRSSNGNVISVVDNQYRQIVSTGNLIGVVGDNLVIKETTTSGGDFKYHVSILKEGENLDLGNIADLAPSEPPWYQNIKSSSDVEKKELRMFTIEQWKLFVQEKTLKGKMYAFEQWKKFNQAGADLDAKRKILEETETNLEIFYR